MSWYRVSDAAAIAPGNAVLVDVDGEDVLLCRTGNGELYAVEDRCSHDGASFGECAIDGTVLECPRHGAQFDVTTGKALKMPAVSPIETRRVRVTDEGAIEVDGEDD